MDLSRAAARLHAWFASAGAPAGHATCSMPLPKAQTDLRGRPMNSVPRVISRESLDWPFFEPRHRAVGEALDGFVLSGAIAAIDHGDVLAPKPADHEGQSRCETRVRPSVSRRHDKTPRLVCSLVPILAISYRTG